MCTYVQGTYNVCSMYFWSKEGKGLKVVSLYPALIVGHLYGVLCLNSGFYHPHTCLGEILMCRVVIMVLSFVVDLRSKTRLNA